MAQVKPSGSSSVVSGLGEDGTGTCTYAASGRERKLLIGLIVYLLCTVLLTGGYVCWMFYQRYQELVEFGDATKWVYLEFLPVWFSLFIFICGLLHFLCDEEGMRAVKHLELSFANIATWKWTNKFSKFWSLLSSYAVGLQVVIILCRSLKSYLGLLPASAACYCQLASGLTDAALYCATVYSCECRVPGTDKFAGIMTSSPSAVSDAVLDDYGLDYTGHVEMWTVAEAADSEQVPWLKKRPHFTMMLLVLHMSVVVTILRVPVTALLTYIAQFKVIESFNESGLEDLKTKQFGPKEVVTQTITMTLILLAAGIDAFAMIDELVSSTSSFVDDVHLANAVLGFVSITLFLTNGVGTANKAQQDVFNYMIMIFTNLPLLVIRSYLYVIDEDLENLEGGSSRSAFFTLFIVKEAILITLSVIELVTDGFFQRAEQAEKAREQGAVEAVATAALDTEAGCCTICGAYSGVCKEFGGCCSICSLMCPCCPCCRADDSW